jgi:starvation-inducible DNA-binding protein
LSGPNFRDFHKMLDDQGQQIYGSIGPLDVLTELMADNGKVAEAMRKAHKICDDNDDVATASILEVYIDETEQRVWFLFESSRSADETGH